MVTVQLNGGLGNQLFQYAAAKSLSLHHGVPLLIDVSSFQRTNLPELEVPRAFELYNFEGVTDKTTVLSKGENERIVRFLKSKSFAKLLPRHKRKIYTEPFYHFDHRFFKSNKNVLLRGQWQSYKYFAPYEAHFKNALQLKQNLIVGVKDKRQELASENSVAVHVRRSDYLRLPVILDWHGVMPTEYYANAFRELGKRLTNYTVYYFTDDSEWVKENLFPIKEGKMVSQNLSKTHYEDFSLMQHCRHNVVANSSFSWWAAWLNRHPDKIVVAPKRWFGKTGPKDTQDLLPEDWIRL